MTDFGITLLTAAIGSAGFAILFRIPPRHLPLATLGGLLAWAAYLGADLFTNLSFLSNLIAALAATLYSEALARVVRTPAVVFMVPCLIPLVPGSSLYHAVSSLFAADHAALYDYAVSTAQVALGIAGGIVLGSLLVSLLWGRLRRNSGR